MTSKKSLISQKYTSTNFSLLTEKEAFKKDVPWEHYILDDFIEEEAFKRMQKALLSEKTKFSVQENDPYFVQFALLEYLPLAKVFYSIEFKSLLEKLSGFPVSLNTSNYVQLRYMNQDSPPLPIHVDTLEGKAIIAIYYLSPNWVEDLGGEFCLYDEFEEETPKALIEPIENRLIVFPSDISTWHGIRKVNNWERYSVLSTWDRKY